MIDYHELFNNATFILLVLLSLACWQLMYISGKRNRLRLGIVSTYRTRIREHVVEVLNGFIEALELVPDVLEFDDERKKKFFLKLGTKKGYVAIKTNDRFLSQQCLWAFNMYVDMLNLDDDCIYNVEHRIFRSITEFCDRAEILYDEENPERMLEFLEKGDELFLSRFEQSTEIITEFKNNPKRFISKLEQ